MEIKVTMLEDGKEPVGVGFKIQSMAKHNRIVIVEVGGDMAAGSVRLPFDVLTAMVSKIMDKKAELDQFVPVTVPLVGFN